MAHILVISQYFYPEQFRINDMCQEWVKRGHKVTVVTGIPNYPQGEFYKGYGWFKNRRETWNGVEIIRLPLVARGHGSVRLALNYLSFVVSGFFWSHFTSLKADYVFTFEVSPMTQALLGVWFAKRRKIPNYLYVQDLWPENVEIVTGIHSKAVLGPISRMVNYIYKRCDAIFATSPSFVTDIQMRCPGQEQKVHYLPQYAEDFYKPAASRHPREADGSQLCHPERNEVKSKDLFKIAFTGNIGKAQGLEILPKTAALLKGKANVNFTIVGDGRNKVELLKQIEENGVGDMFTMIDRQPAEKIPAILAECDAAFISFMDTPLFTKTIPAKLQSYMACGKPIVASACGETERIVREANCGVCAPIGDADALARAILEVKDNPELLQMGKNAVEYSEVHFSKAKLMDEIEEYWRT
ncbi:glycosyltransferase WbuB [Fibrobacter sp. UWB1]|uniref:glycosyltransferase family 4 protein n=1 Tax=Fibrobacter sp. UWB1 TaxID=1964355 RepID=UPI000B527607|nr:glycosyltransferase family 4 protein [Fibrobacter sp. UWB1]OWV26298.1 glycosyltransferase WbuB [Fibrobacter sp. UWB1]